MRKTKSSEGSNQACTSGVSPPTDQVLLTTKACTLRGCLIEHSALLAMFLGDLAFFPKNKFGIVIVAIKGGKPYLVRADDLDRGYHRFVFQLLPETKVRSVKQFGLELSAALRSRKNDEGTTLNAFLVRVARGSFSAMVLMIASS